MRPATAEQVGRCDFCRKRVAEGALVRVNAHGFGHARCAERFVASTLKDVILPVLRRCLDVAEPTLCKIADELASEVASADPVVFRDGGTYWPPPH